MYLLLETVLAIDNIFIVVSQFESYTVIPIINGMSDHDAQLLTISTDYSHVPIHRSKTVRKIISIQFLILLIS